MKRTIRRCHSISIAAAAVALQVSSARLKRLGRRVVLRPHIEEAVAAGCVQRNAQDHVSTSGTGNEQRRGQQLEVRPGWARPIRPSGKTNKQKQD